MKQLIAELQAKPPAEAAKDLPARPAQ
jgi:hypothetical protein